MMERHDDVLDRDGQGQDDSWEIQLDADHAGGSIWFSSYEIPVEQERVFNSGRWNQAWRLSLPPLADGADDHRGWRWFWVSQATWTDELPWADFGFRMAGEIGGPSTSFHEYMTAGWDDLDWRDPDASVVHDFREGEIIGLNWGVADWDVLGPDNPRAGYWTLNQAQDGWKTADSAADFLLATLEDSSVPVLPNTWGRLKAAFSQR